MKKVLEALIALLIFDTYTNYSRWFEIGCGIIAWSCISLIIYVII